MTLKKINPYLLSCLLLIGPAILNDTSIAQEDKDRWTPSIPKVWVDAEMAELEVPLANPIGSPKHISAEYYYQIPVREIYKTYPVYSPGKEPPGYVDWLKDQEPEIVFDASKLKTKVDWIKAGELVFDTPIATGGLGIRKNPNELYLREPGWYERTRAPLTKDGVLPFYRYVITEKGKIGIGILSCAMCHTRVMPEGNVIKGAQGNFPFDRAYAEDYRTPPGQVEGARMLETFLFNTPWVEPTLETKLSTMTLEDITAVHDAIPPGVLARHRTTPDQPTQTPDLIGVRERKYLDRTGLQVHRDIVDMMRYAALNQGADDLASYAGFVPAGKDFQTLPDPATQLRYSDEQLYALALYLYSLEAPPNPNPFDALAKRGEEVFQVEGCASCHTPPLYTNNQLTPADGFTVPPDHHQKYDILTESLGTDPRLTLRTRRGTGYYKVPSLKGVWYRGPFEHNGSVATLEDWFDPKRLSDDYVPTGFIGHGITTRAVKGHEFGLLLSAEDKRALIAFLKTL